jgi:hypothetical protein
MSRPLFSRWARLLRSAAALTLGERGPNAAAPAADELGHRRPVDGPFLAWRTRTPPPPVSHSNDADAEIWTALAAGSPIPQVLEAALAQRTPAPLTPPIDPASPDMTLEVWTERELALLHGAWRLAQLRARADLADRCLLAADWHVEHMQPDNATNRPWALPVFVAAAAARISAEHELYAQMLLHNCQIMYGRPDLVSAHILLDSAESLEDHAGIVRTA